MNRREGTVEPGQLRVYYLDGVPAQASARYRVFNALEQLRLAGVEGVLLPQDYDPGSVLSERDQGQAVLIIHRAPWDERLAALIDAARAQGTKVLYDIDDLVFDPLVLPWVRALSRLTDVERDLYEDGVRRYQRALRSCDGVLTTTRALAAIAAAEGVPAFVHRNALDARSIDTARAARNLRQARDETVLYYGAGTSTHDVDFQECNAALELLLRKHPSVHLLVQGDVELGPSLDMFGARIRRWPWMPWPDYFWGIAQADVNIAPLELSSPFCNVKSELKWFESAILGLPSVVSATDAYREVIRHGENGFLVRTNDEWFECLDELVSDPGRRNAVADAAEADATPRYTPAAMGEHLAGLLANVSSSQDLASLAVELGEDAASVVEPGERQHPAPTYTSNGGHPDKPRLKIGFLATSPIRGGGGSRIIMQMARHLKSFGHDVTLYMEPLGHFRSEKEMQNFLAANFPGEPIPAVMGLDKTQPSDAFIASFWLTAQALRDINHTRGKFYLVQDFEPYFYSMGGEYLGAEETYRNGFHHVSIGPWCAAFLKEHYHARADYFDFPLDRSVYYRRPIGGVRLQSRVLFFSRPEMPRRCYDLGIEALSRLKARRADVQITLFGSDDVDTRSVPFPCENLKNVSDRNKLAELYSSADVALVLSATNTSLVPYEAVACGCPVVDLDIEGNRVNYRGSDAVVLARPDPEALADALCAILDDTDAQEHRRAAGLRLAESMPTEEQSARRFEEILLQGLGLAPVSPEETSGSRNGRTERMEGLLLDVTCRADDAGAVELRPGREVNQTFRCNFPSLAAVSVKVANFGRANPCSLEMSISEDGAAAPLQRIRESLLETADNSWLTFRFTPLPDSAGKDYRLTFSCPDANPSDTVALYHSNKSAYPDGKMSPDGRAGRGALVFQTFVERDDEEELRRLLRPEQAALRTMGWGTNGSSAAAPPAAAAGTNGNLWYDELRAMRRRLERMEHRQNDVTLRVSEIHNFVTAMRGSLPYRAARRCARALHLVRR